MKFVSAFSLRSNSDKDAREEIEIAIRVPHAITCRYRMKKFDQWL